MVVQFLIPKKEKYPSVKYKVVDHSGGKETSTIPRDSGKNPGNTLRKSNCEARVKN